MERKVIEIYARPLKDTFDYIDNKRNRSSRRNWTDEQREKWSLRYRQCPICQQNWSKENSMTKEHIHPLVLGGFERDENIIPLCMKCNSARNSVMVDVLGSSDIKMIRNRMPAIKVAIQEFVVWCHASIYLDEVALSQCSDLSEAFAKQRGIPNPYRVSNTINQPKKSIFSIIKQPFDFLIDKIKGPSQVSKANQTTESDSATSKIDNPNEKSAPVEKSLNPVQSVETNGKTSIDENEITIFLRNSIKKRIPTMTYRSGFSASQLAYIMKQAKDHFEISWSELFNPFNPEGTTIQEKSVSIIPSLGFLLEEKIGEDEKVVYKITQNKGPEKANNPDIFDLDSWLKENWKGIESYSELTKSILEYENSSNGKKRNLRVILKQDFGIAKSKPAKIVKKDLHERYLKQKTPDSTQKKPTSDIENLLAKLSVAKDIFPLKPWLDENWVDKSSYPGLRKSISEFESKKENPRNLREILKQDFEIPKSWSVKQISKRMKELKLASI